VVSRALWIIGRSKLQGLPAECDLDATLADNLPERRYFHG
jgi:hypothetical protein